MAYTSSTSATVDTSTSSGSRSSSRYNDLKKLKIVPIPNSAIFWPSENKAEYRAEDDPLMTDVYRNDLIKREEEFNKRHLIIPEKKFFYWDYYKPFLSTENLKFHYRCEYAEYCSKLTALIRNTEYEEYTLEEMVTDQNKPVSDYAGHILNHKIFFSSIQCSPYPSVNVPIGKLAIKIEKSFGSYPKMEAAFIKAAMNLEGSGWVWLVMDKNEIVHILTTQNSTHPIILGSQYQPLLNIDLWEHAYGPDFGFDKEKYIRAFFKMINWIHANSLIS